MTDRLRQRQCTVFAIRGRFMETKKELRKYYIEGAAALAEMRSGEKRVTVRRDMLA